MDVIPFAFMKLSTPPAIITGADGALNIANGVTVDVAEGSVKNYSSINIATGGTLRITGNTGAWTEIGCAGNCVINGQILARSGYDGQATHSGGTFTKTSAFGLGSLSYTITQSSGGAGGAGNGAYSSFSLGGAQSLGRGGGGGGVTSVATGGSGGAGGSNGQAASGSGGAGGGLGNGSTNSGVNGGAGSGGGGAGGANGGTTYGGGAGGGYKGHHGGGLLLYIEGALSGTGTINLSGRNGFSGGTATALNTKTGGGGGGGAGGSGGKLIVKYKTLTATPTITVAGGTGGSAGGGWVAGGAGTTGSAGTSSVTAI